MKSLPQTLMGLFTPALIGLVFATFLALIVIDTLSGKIVWLLFTISVLITLAGLLGWAVREEKDTSRQGKARSKSNVRHDNVRE